LIGREVTAQHLQTTPNGVDVSILHARHQQPRDRDNLGLRPNQARDLIPDRENAVALDGDLRWLRPGRQERLAARENEICIHRGIR
jgi:hypothetical protein